jgi:hypothetical protein
MINLVRIHMWPNVGTRIMGTSIVHTVTQSTTARFFASDASVVQRPLCRSPSDSPTLLAGVDRSTRSFGHDAPRFQFVKQP